MSRRHRQVLIGILIVSVVLRIGVALYYGNWVPPNQDDNSYSQLGWRVANGHGYSFDRAWYPFTPAETPTAHWSFLYTAFVAGIYALVGYQPLVVRLVGAILGGLLLPWMVYRFTARLLPRRQRLALLAAACAAVYAYFVLYAARIMTETFYIAAVLWSMERALAWRDELEAGQGISPQLVLTLGLSLGLATLLRQSILPWVLVLSLWLLWLGYRWRRLLDVLKALALAGLLTLACILPFTIRNHVVYGEFLLLNSNAGYAMYSGQHPMHGISFQEHAAAPLPDDLDGTNEAQWDRALLGRGMRFVLDDPGRYLLLSLSRVVDYYRFWPTADSSLLFNVGRVVSFALFMPFMLYGLFGQVRRLVKASRDCCHWTTRPLALVLLFVTFYPLLHILTWAMIRYRLPVDAVMLSLAASALLDLWHWLRSNRHVLSMTA